MNEMEVSKKMDDFLITPEADFLVEAKPEKVGIDKMYKYLHFLEICNVESELYIFDGTFWENDVKKNKDKIRALIFKIEPKVTTANINEVFENLRVNAPKKTKHQNAISFKNCIYDFDKKTTFKNNELIPAFKINRNLLNNTDELFSNEIVKLIKKLSCDNEEVITALVELLADIIEPKRKNQKIFFQFGETANNGKSTFNKIITNAIGIENVSNVPIHKIADKNDKFATSSIAGKLVNFDDDLTADFMSSENLKTLTGGNTIRIEKKGQDAYDVELNATLIANCNKLPNIDINDAGVNRRIQIIPFEAKMNDTFEQWEKLERIYFSDDFAEHLIQLAILKNAKINGKISENTLSEKYKTELKNNKIDELEFVEELINIITNDKEAREFLCLTEFENFDVKEPLIKKTQLYKSYQTWAKDAGIRFVNKRADFIKILEKHGKIKEVVYSKRDGKYKKGTKYLKIFSE